MKERLIKLNQSFISQHGDLNESDYANIEHYSGLIEVARLSKNTPQVGDLVEGAYYDGSYPYRFGLIEKIYDDGKVSICYQPYIPFISSDKTGKIYLSVSGGPFGHHEIEELELICESEDRCFQFFGHSGACANGAVTFPAKVRRWRIPYERKPISYVILDKETEIAKGYYGGGSMFIAFEAKRSKLNDLAKYMGFELERRDGQCGEGKVYYRMSHNIVDGRYFWELNELPANARPIKGMSNGREVTCYFVNDGFTITIFRPNPNAKDMMVDTGCVYSIIL